MNCIKCGREIPETQAFCDHCLEAMKAHPVKPGTPIQLPQRKPVTAEKKRPQKEALPPEKVVVLQRKLLRRLLIALAIHLLAIGVLIIFLLDARNVISLASLFGLFGF